MKALLFDLDGTLYEDGVPLPGAAEAVAELRRRGVQVGFVTNTTSRSRRLLTERLRRCGIAAQPEQIVTALRAGAAHLAERGFRRISALVPETAHEDLADFELTDERPEAVPLEVGLQSGPDIAIVGQCIGREPAADRPEIEAGPPDEQGDATALSDAAESGAGVIDEARHRDRRHEVCRPRWPKDQSLCRRHRG